MVARKTTVKTGRLRSAKLGAALAAAALAVVLAGVLARGPQALAESKAKERLAGDLELLTAGQMEDSPIVPKVDRKRTAKCLAQALAADIPEEEAARLSDIFEGRVSKSDPALQKKWLSISAKDAPARNAQVLGRVDKLCPDLGPYIKQMM